MSTQITKTWFVDGQIIEQEIPEADIYRQETLRLAELCEGSANAGSTEPWTRRQAAAELRRLHEEVSILRSDPGNRFAHRLAIELECALLAPEQASADLLDEYHTAVREWMEANGQPYVSGFGKD